MAQRERVVPMIHVPDVRATVNWYKNIGFTVDETYNDGGAGLSFAILSFGSSEVMFNSGGEPSSRKRREVDLYVYADNVDDIYERLKDRVEVFEGPHDTFYGMREFIIRDLNRFWITFGQDSPAASTDILEIRLQAQVNRLQRLLPNETSTACQKVARKIQDRLPLLLASPDWEENLLREIRLELASLPIGQLDAPDIQHTPPTGPIIAAAFSTVAAIVTLTSDLIEKANEAQEPGKEKELQGMKEMLMTGVNPWISWLEQQADHVFVPRRS